MAQSSTLGAVPASSGYNVRVNLNASDEALASENEGASAPGLTWPHMRWRDHASGLRYRRNAGNTGLGDRRGLRQNHRPRRDRRRCRRLRRRVALDQHHRRPRLRLHRSRDRGGGLAHRRDHRADRHRHQLSRLAGRGRRVLPHRPRCPVRLRRDPVEMAGRAGKRRRRVQRRSRPEHLHAPLQRRRLLGVAKAS